VDIRRVSVIGLLAFSVLALGCTSKSGSNRLLSRSAGGAGQSSASAPLGDSRYEDLVREMQENGGQATFDARPKSTTQKVSGALKKATATVGGALTLKPRVDKAPDPLALDNMPAKIGIDLYYQSGRLAESNGNPAAAIKQYERGLEENPDHLPTLISLARLYDRQDEFDEAEKLYLRALEAEPDNAMAHNDRGLCLARHDQAEPALTELRQAVKLEPNRKLYRNNLATVLVDLGRVDEAWNELSAAHPSAVAHYNLGYLLYHAGNKPRAYQEFTLAKQGDTSLVVAQQMLDQLDAETRRVGKTEVAMAPTKVQCRIEDLAPQPTTVDKRPQTYPVAVVHSPPELRRTPPTGKSPESESSPAPASQLKEPVPLAPADAGASPSIAPPAPVPQPPSGELLIRTTSGAMVVEEVEELALPTPSLLDDVRTTQREPQPFSPPAQPGMK
jgi:tetratricopeptide (TPR) repeat protein